MDLYEPFSSEYRSLQSKINALIETNPNSVEDQLKSISIPTNTLKSQILNLNTNIHNKSIIYNLYLELQKHEVNSQAYNDIFEQLDWYVKLPYDNISSFPTQTNLNKFYTEIMNKLDQKLYGMKSIKLKLLQIINSRLTSPNYKSRGLAIIGAPGTGKTAVAKAIAEAMGLPFSKISAGGMEDASSIKGSNKVFCRSEPSEILKKMVEMKSSDGVILVDEIDKPGRSDKGKAVLEAFLHIADPANNTEYNDMFLDKISHDLSKLFFIYTMNSDECLDSAFLDRLDLFYTQPYSKEEKINIILDYFFPTKLKEFNMAGQIKLTRDVAKIIVNLTSKNDPGCRGIEKLVENIVSKISLYKNSLRKDGTTGNLDLGFTISNFRVPLTINKNILKQILQK